VKNKQQIRIEISFEFYSEQESFNVIARVCAYAGVSNPEVEDDFGILGPANEVAGWKKYTYAPTVHTGFEGEVWVAVGITVAWETEMTYNIDDLRVTVS
jgi:hypothetical protein